MKNLPAYSISYKPLLDMLMGQINSRLLVVAVKLNVFNHMVDFAAPEHIAAKIGSQPENTRRFLDALAMLDLIEKKHGRYRNSPAVALYLVDTAPQYLGGFFGMIESMSLAPLEHLDALVLDGASAPEDATAFGDAQFWADCTRCSAPWVYGELGQTVGGIVSGLPDAASIGHMLDLGGGHGIFTLYIAAALPGLTGIIFDREPVVSVAQSFIDEYGFQERIGVEPGDYMTDDIGGDYDLVWASATLNFARDTIDQLIHKIHGSLNPGGYFISFQDGLTDEYTKPLTMLSHVINSLQVGRDFSFAQGEIADAMIRCGFASVRSRTIDTPMGAMDMDIARKCR